MNSFDGAENTAPKQRGRPFEPGKSGNPQGRPKGARNHATVLAEALLDGEAEAIIRKVVDRAKEGDTTALRLCLERLLAPKRGRHVAFQLPTKIETFADAVRASSLVQAECAAGNLTPGEASEIVGTISSHVKLIEMAKFDARLTALEGTAAMNSRQLRTQLDRLSRSANRPIRENKDRGFEFNIDPAEANALRDDRNRLDELERARSDFFTRTKGPDTEEERVLRSRIAERAGKIRCSADYGFNEAWDDRVLLLAAEHSEDLPPWFAHLTPLNEFEDSEAEKAQAIARIEVFNQTPEGRARTRIAELERHESMSSAEQSELDDLLTRYPEPNCHPKDPMIDAMRAWKRAARSTAEEDKLLIERANRLRRRTD